jgi:hypothetical protein
VASPAYRASTAWRAAATSLCASVAGWLHNSFRYYRPIVARWLRQWIEYLYPIVAAYLGKSSRYVRATAANWLRQSNDCLAASIAYLGRSYKKELAIVAVIAVVSGLVGFVTTSALLRRPVPAMAAIETRPQPKPSWVTDYEIERAQKLGRLLLNISPAELLAMYERNGGDAIESYRDGWVKLDYPIVSFDRQTFGKIPYDVVEAAAHFHSVFPGKIIAVFNAQMWGPQLRMHRAGDQLVAFCKFKEIEREQVLTNIDRLWFYGTGCDLPQLLESTHTAIVR